MARLFREELFSAASLSWLEKNLLSLELFFYYFPWLNQICSSLILSSQCGWAFLWSFIMFRSREQDEDILPVPEHIGSRLQWYKTLIKIKWKYCQIGDIQYLFYESIFTLKNLNSYRWTIVDTIVLLLCYSCICMYCIYMYIIYSSP